MTGTKQANTRTREGDHKTDHIRNTARARIGGRAAVERRTQPGAMDSYPSNGVQAGIGGRGWSTSGWAAMPTLPFTIQRRLG